MKYSKETINFVDELIDSYARYDYIGDCYTIYIEDITDIDLCKFSALMMLDDSDHASESTGPDNSQYKHNLLPTLINFLFDTSDEDRKEEFTSTWARGIGFHFNKRLRELLQERIGEYNSLKGCYIKYPTRESVKELPWS